jgi:hypothetical protein
MDLCSKFLRAFLSEMYQSSIVLFCSTIETLYSTHQSALDRHVHLNVPVHRRLTACLSTVKGTLPKVQYRTAHTTLLHPLLHYQQRSGVRQMEKTGRHLKPSAVRDEGGVLSVFSFVCSYCLAYYGETAYYCYSPSGVKRSRRRQIVALIPGQFRQASIGLRSTHAW